MLGGGGSDVQERRTILLHLTLALLPYLEWLILGAFRELGIPFTQKGDQENPLVVSIRPPLLMVSVLGHSPLILNCELGKCTRFVSHLLVGDRKNGALALFATAIILKVPRVGLISLEVMFVLCTRTLVVTTRHHLFWMFRRVTPLCIENRLEMFGGRVVTLETPGMML